MNLSPLEQQPVLLTTEPSLNHVLKIIIIIEKKRGEEQLGRWFMG